MAESGAAQSSAAAAAIGPWPRGISANTLFVEDLAGTDRLYPEVVGLPITFEDEAGHIWELAQ